jgi:serine protease Do
MKQKITYILTIICAVFIGIIGTIICLRYVPTTQTVVTSDGTKKNVTVTETNTIKDAIDKIYNAVYLIEAYKNSQKISSGTGFAYKKDSKYGYVITNQHVIENADQVKITTIDGNTVEAKVLGSDEYSDIAVLSIDDSSKLSLGDTLFTVGSPLGSNYMGTVTKGILSGNNRTVTTSNNVMEVLQTDAAINPGNSGGPLCNVNGEVIGVNSLKLVQDEIEGMGFAIPIELVMTSVDSLEQGKEIERPMIGVEMLNVSNTYALYRYGITLKDKTITSGVVVVTVTSGSPAEDSGIKKGDIITKIGDEEVGNTAEFRHTLYKYKVGDTVKVTFIRDGKQKTVNVKLTKKSE